MPYRWHRRGDGGKSNVHRLEPGGIRGAAKRSQGPSAHATGARAYWGVDGDLRMFRSREGTNTFRAVQRATRSPLMRAEGQFPRYWTYRRGVNTCGRSAGAASIAPPTSLANEPALVSNTRRSRRLVPYVRREMSCPSGQLGLHLQDLVAASRSSARHLPRHTRGQSPPAGSSSHRAMPLPTPTLCRIGATHHRS